MVARLIELDIAKGIGIILVVLGHSFLLPGPTETSNLFLSTLRMTIYSFHMPLFFFISGYFMQIKGIGLKEIIVKKAKRLLIPYFFFGLLFAPIKSYFSYLAHNSYQMSRFWELFWGGVNPIGELWFLYFLFLISAVYYLLRKIFSAHLIVLLAFIGYSILAMFEVSNQFARNLFYFFPYFSLGVVIKEHNWLKNISINVYFLLMGLFFFSLLNYFLYPIYYSNKFSIWCYLIMTGTSLIGIYISFVISSWISKLGSMTFVEKQLSELGSFSMDIYILSDFITLGTRLIFLKMLHEYHMAWILGFIGGVWGAYYLSKYVVRKTEWMKKLILGI